MDESRHSANAQHPQPVYLLPAAPLHEGAPTLRVYLLGGFTITLGERSLDASAWRLRKAQSLVKLLVLAPGHRLHRERVLDLLWPDLELEAAANNLHYTMHSARTTLASLLEPPTPTILPSGSHPRPRTGTLLRLRQQIVALESPTPLWVDADAFDDAAASARLGTDPLRYEAAINLYGGDLLPDDRYEDWAANRREALGANYQALLLAVAQLYVSQDNPTAAIDAFHRVLASEPAHEEAHRRLMRLYALTGQRHHAMRQYERLREALRRELEMLPCQESRSLYDDILAGRLIPESSVTMERPAPSEMRIALGQSLAAATPDTPDDSTQVAPGAAANPTLKAASALVGRQDVLAQLRDVWAAAATEPQALLIVGEAGIGKSRIAEEALAWAAGRHHRDGKPIIKTALARCYLAEGELPFGVVTTWLRSRSLWPGALALDEVWQVEVARVVPEMLIERPSLRLPPPLPERMQRQRLFDAFARAVTQSGHPLLLVIDDLQWCERETLEWLRYLLRQTVRAPLLVLGTVRAEEVTPDHPLVDWTTDLRRVGQFTEIALGPLDVTETTALGAQVVGQALDATQAERLYAETEGSPLFVVESLRAGLLNKSIVPATADRTVGTDSGSLPLTLQTVMTRRLRQLSPRARDLSGLAAVVGREFSADLLIEASHTGGYTEESIIQALEELQQRRIVREQGAGGYDFSHDKLRETAYAELSAARRRMFHRRVARALEVISADALDEVSAQLAMHYEHGGETKKACYALERAGLLAIQRGAMLIARDNLQRAVALASVDDQMRCYEELGDSYAVFGAYAFGQYRIALERWQSLDSTGQDPLIGARLLRKMLFVWLRSAVIPQPSRDELATMAVEAQALAERAGDEVELQRVRVAAQGLNWRKEMNDRPVTVDYIRSGQVEFLALVDSFAARGNWEDFDVALDVFTTCFQEIGAFDEALEIAHRRLRASNLPPHLQGDVIGMVARTNFMMGNFQGCMDTLRAAWQTSRPDVPLLISGSLYGTYSALYIGAWDELDTFAAIDERVWNDSGHIETDTLRSYWALIHVGLARGNQSAIDIATAKLEQWLAIAPNCDSTSPALLAAYLADNPEPLVSIYPSDKWTPVNLCLALMFFNERGIPSPPGIFDRAVKRMPLYADYCQMCIRMAEAVATTDSASLAAIIEEFEAHGLIPHAARTRIVLAQWTGDRTHLERSRPVLERLGDRQFLRRLETVATTLEYEQDRLQ